MNLHELATRLRNAVAPFASAQELEDTDDDLFAGEDGIALEGCIYIASERRVHIDAVLLADLHAARRLLSEEYQARLDGLTRVAA